MTTSTHTGARRKVLVTAALPYSNSRPHVGHLGGAYVPADTYVRYLRMTGADVRFVCGSDDHGVAIMITAEKEGKTPAEVANYYRARQLEDFTQVGISFDIYSGTSTCPYHVEESQRFFTALHEKGYFEKGTSRQFYDEGREAFLPDRYVKGTCGYCGAPDQNSDQCENCGKVLDVDTLKDPRSIVSGSAASIRETMHWFLDLSRFAGDVEKWLETAQVRDQTKAFVRGLLDSGLIKRSMTRDISWGIPVPLDDPDAAKKVLYVWFDAPIGYISFTKELCAREGQPPESYNEWWRSPETEVYHFIGEDNTVFHCVIWIAMLTAEGSITLPKGVIVNHFYNIQIGDGPAEKISKSKGNDSWMREYLAAGGDVDSLRYYLTTVATERARAVFKTEDLELRHNGELADTLGNLVNRITSFSLKHCGARVPLFEKGSITDTDRAFEAALHTTFEEATRLLESHSFKGALEQIMEFARACNRYVDEKAPWTTRKTDMEVTKVTLAYALRAIHGLGVMLTPFIPTAAGKIVEAFGRKADEVRWNDAVELEIVDRPLSQPPILFKKVVREG